MLNEARILRAIRRSYVEANIAVRDARDCLSAGYSIGVRACMEKIAMHRKLNRERRRALKLRRTI